jgi:predicted RNA-binding protein with PIN domain
VPRANQGCYPGGRLRSDRGGVEVVYCAACEADSFLVEEARRRRGAGAARVMIATNDTDVQARSRGRCCQC